MLGCLKVLLHLLLLWWGGVFGLLFILFFSSLLVRFFAFGLLQIFLLAILHEFLKFAALAH